MLKKYRNDLDMHNYCVYTLLHKIMTTDYNSAKKYIETMTQSQSITYQKDQDLLQQQEY